MSALLPQSKMLLALAKALKESAQAARDDAERHKETSPPLAAVYLTNAHLLMDLSLACANASEDLDKQIRQAL